MRTCWTAGCSALPLVENDSMATTGFWPVSLAKVRLVDRAMSASCVASGCGTTAQSAYANTRASGITRRKQLVTVLTPAARPMIRIPARMTSAVERADPPTQASARPARTAAAPMYSGSPASAARSRAGIPRFASASLIRPAILGSLRAAAGASTSTPSQPGWRSDSSTGLTGVVAASCRAASAVLGSSPSVRTTRGLLSARRARHRCARSSIPSPGPVVSAASMAGYVIGWPATSSRGFPPGPRRARGCTGGPRGGHRPSAGAARRPRPPARVPGR